MTLSDSDPNLLHVVSISTRCPQACLEAVADILGRCEGRVRGFALKPSGDRFEAVLRLSDIDEASAWRMAGLISAWPHAGSAHIEHHMLAS
jgi:hypothetical protein